MKNNSLVRCGVSSLGGLVLAVGLSACGGGGGSGAAPLPVVSCLDNLADIGGLEEVSVAALDNLSPEQLTQVATSLSAATGQSITTLGDLLAIAQSGMVAVDVVECALQNALAGQGITDSSQLPTGDLGALLGNLPLGPALDDALDEVAPDALQPLGGFGGLLGAVQAGQIDRLVSVSLVNSALTVVNDASPVLNAPNAFAPGLDVIFDQLDAGLPGGLDSVSDADLLTLAESVNVANVMGTAEPVVAALANITGSLTPDDAEAITGPILGSLAGLLQ